MFYNTIILRSGCGENLSVNISIYISHQNFDNKIDAIKNLAQEFFENYTKQCLYGGLFRCCYEQRAKNILNKQANHLCGECGFPLIKMWNEKMFHLFLKESWCSTVGHRYEQFDNKWKPLENFEQFIINDNYENTIFIDERAEEVLTVLLNETIVKTVETGRPQDYRQKLLAQFYH